jgi:hypothetical protein
MTTWGSLLAEIRIDLKDTGATPRWSSDTIYLYAKDAIRAYSQDLPLEIHSEAIAAISGSYPLPGNFLAVTSVENANGYLSRYDVRPGRKSRTPLHATKFYVSGRRLYTDLPPTDGDIIHVTYRAIHDIPTVADDLTSELTIPVEDEELIRIYVKGKVIEQMRTGQSALDRFKPGSGDRTDNPLSPEYKSLFDEFDRRIAMKLGGVIHLQSSRRSA